MFKGSFTALITPFKNGEVDEAAFKRLVDWQIKEGTHGLVPCGTTGESPTLDHGEHNRVIELCVKTAKGRVPVMAGTGSNSTDEAVAMTKFAEKAGADGALLAAPYYNKPTQEGLYQHFKAIHDETRIPLFLYNIPGRSVVDMKDELIARLAQLPRIKGLKDATGDLARPLSLAMQLRKRKHDFIQLSGEDATAIAFNVHGGKGCISVTSNIAPKLCAQLQDASLKGDIAKAMKIQEKLMPIHKAMFVETSPGPVKYAASLMGICKAEWRLPLVPPSKASQQQVKEALELAGLI
ncbi:MAG: 4-hydroxy-tetrahydrodipicolinate synthase [Proteobacteria bacterium]|nr:4-hydroxy-tetrahydrodipicolinate synthase [Pseudomonadota bacterium]